ncbi:hypothetical protein [Desulfonauticus submarinus]
MSKEFELGIVLLVIGTVILLDIQKGAPIPTETGVAKLVIKNVSVEYESVSLDKICISVNVTIKNVGSSSFGSAFAPPKKIIFETVVHGNQQVNSCLVRIKPNGTFHFKSLFFEIFEIKRDLGEYKKYKGIVFLKNESGKILDKKEFFVSPPTAKVGDTTSVGRHNLSLTLLSLKESKVAVYGPYGLDNEYYYTFTAKPGMKFIILIYKVQNKWKRSQKTPVFLGKIATDRGHVYSYWTPPRGIWSWEYKPIEAAPEEVRTLIGKSGSYEYLAPRESTMGCLIFEIPSHEIPVEASITDVPVLIKLK